MRHHLPASALCIATCVAGCGEDGGSTSFATSGVSTGATSMVDTGATTSAMATSTAAHTASDGAGTDGADEGEPPEPLCDVISVPLVVDRHAPVHDASARDALRAFFDDLVMQTGAEVRIFPNGAAPAPPFWLCLQDSDDGHTFVWGQDFVPDPAAAEVLDCVLDGTRDATYETGGNWVFTGLVQPLLDHIEWPAPDTDVTLAVLLAKSDDGQGGMVARPGMINEAFIRLAGAEDRRRVAAFAMGEAADKLHTFTLSLGETSQYHDWAQTDLPAALSAWTPAAVEACAEHDAPPLPVMPGGCEHIDILFVIDGSASMGEEQAALRGDGDQPPIFKEFTDALVSELDTLVDFHVGIVSSEPGDVVLHTHHDEPAMAPSPETDCGLPTGQRWLVGPSPALEDDFACLASTRSDQFDERTAENAALALHDPANRGFLRDDAILFLVMVTDEDTQDTLRRVQLRDLILEALGGQLERLVVLAIAGDQGVFEAPKSTCWDGVYGSAAPGRRITDIVYSFREQGTVEDICAGDFTTAFTDILDDVVTTCLNFTPQG